MVIQGRTLRQIRQAVGDNLLGSRLHISATSSAGSDASSVIDNTLRGGDDNHIGNWIRSNSGDNEDEVTRVSDYDSSATDMTVSPAFTNTVPSAMDYEKWPDEYDPRRIDRFIQQAIIDITGRAFNWQEDRSLHLHSDEYRYAIPSTLDMISGLEYRSRIRIEKFVDGGESVWTELNSTTASVDTEVKRRGNSSAKLVVTSGESQNTNLAQVTVDGSSIDVNKYDTIEWWAKSASAISTAGDLRWGFEGGTGLDPVDWPALSADTWEYHRVSLTKTGGASSDITDIKLNYNGSSSMAAGTFWVEEIRLVASLSGQWTKIPMNHWYVDRENREIVFTLRPPYGLLKIKGGDKPAIPSSDTDTLEVDDWFVICRATALAFQSASLGPNLDAEQRRQQVAAWEQRAQRTRRSNFQPLTNARMVS